MPMRITHLDAVATHSPVRRMGLTVVVVVALLLALPALASGAIKTEVVRDTLMVTGDGEPDQITLTVSPQGTIAVNGVATTLPSGAAADINVAALGGADVVNARALLATDYDSMRLRGGAGNDNLTGGLGIDALFGDEDGDVLHGTPGDDFLEGGPGDDTATWANGDNNDEIVGSFGEDTVELRGHPTETDILFFRPSLLQPDWVLFRRQDAPPVNPFAVELLDVETTSIHLEGGGDFIGPEGAGGIDGLTDLVIHGGTGVDQLNGSNGADAIDGGPDNDSMIGGDGDDLLFDGPGDDMVSWSAGDGDDEVLASPNVLLERDELVAIGSPARDEFRLSRAAGTTKLAGRAVGEPFEIGTAAAAGNGSIERFTVVAEGGADDLVFEPGMPDIQVLADGGGGDDLLIGGEEQDILIGGPESDTLIPGRGRDIAEGEEGDDLLVTRDGERDTAIGGAGIDEAETDVFSIDTVTEVEEAIPGDPGDPDPGPGDPGPGDPGPGDPGPGGPGDPGPKPDPGPRPPVLDALALPPSLGKLSLIGSRRLPVATFPLACPAAEAGGCRTTVTLETAMAVRLGDRKAILRLGSAKLELAAGATVTARVRLNRRTATLLERGKLPVRIRIASTDAAGNAAASSATRVLKPRR
jgi:RTX calcium-binding nonapeptide repeat (4 copies)